MYTPTSFSFTIYKWVLRGSKFYRYVLVMIGISTLTMLKAEPADDTFMGLFVLLQKVGFDISCKLSPKETVCMKCQILLSGKKIRGQFA